MAKKLERYQEIERSIITTYRKTIWSPFVLAVKKYHLIDAGDKIAVCISGGKDSMLLAKLMQELSRHSEVPFELVFLVMDPGYNDENRKKIEENAKGWKLSRISKVSMAIMRICVYEMLYVEDVPFNIAINEAVELAKKFDYDKAPSFINGVVNKIAENEGLKK